MKKKYDSEPLMLTNIDKGRIYVMTYREFPDCVRVCNSNLYLSSEEVNMGSSESNFAWEHFIEENIWQIFWKICSELEPFKHKKHRYFYKLSENTAIERIKKIVDAYHSVFWNGIRYRKRQHVYWADFFIKNKIPYEYLFEPIKLFSGKSILPDFYLPELSCYIFISQNFMQTSSGYCNSFELCENTGKSVFQLWGCKAGFMSDQIIQEFFYPGSCIIRKGPYVKAIELQNFEILNHMPIGLPDG